MRRSLSILLVMLFLFLPGCALPLDKEANDLIDEDIQQSTSADGAVSGENEPEVESPQKAIDTVIPDDEKMYVTLYYQDGDGILIPVSRVVRKQEGIAKVTVTGLIDSAINREEIEYYGIYPVLPEGTEVLGLNIKEGTATIDFNESILQYEDAISERNVISSVVYTLTEFSTVENVKILINGHNQAKLKYGTDISGDLNRQNILVNSDKANLGKGSMKLDAYLSKNINNKYIYLVPFSVETEVLDESRIPGNIITLLCKKYNIRNVYSEIPEGTKLISSNLENGQLTLDFNAEFRNYGGNTKEDIIIKQILYSMKQIRGVTKIKLLVNGGEANLPEGTDTKNGFVLPSYINTVMSYETD